MKDDILLEKKMEEFHYYDILGVNYPTPDIERDFPDRVIRAAQFAPFAALVGYDEAIKEEGRQTMERMELDEYQKLEIGERLRILNVSKDKASVTYFVPDSGKSGGEYVTRTGSIRDINEYEKTIEMDDGAIIPIEDIAVTELFR